MKGRYDGEEAGGSHWPASSNLPGNFMNVRALFVLVLLATLSGCEQAKPVAEDQPPGGSQEAPTSARHSFAKVNPEYARSSRTFRMTPHLALAQNSAPVTDIAVSADGTKIATAANEVNICDAKTGERLVRIPLDTEGLEEYVPVRVAFSPTAPLLAVAVGDEISLHDTKTGERTKTLEVKQPRDVLFVQFTADGKWLIALEPYHALVFETEQFSLHRKIECDSFFSNSIALTPDSRQVVVSGEWGSIDFYDIASGELAFQFPGAKADPATDPDGVTPQAMAINRDGSILATINLEDQLTIFDLKKKAKRFVVDQSGNDLEFSADGLLAIFDSDVLLCEVADKQLLPLSYLPIRDYSPHGAVTFNPDGSQLITAGFNTPQQADVFQVEWSQEKEIIASRKEAIYSVAASPDGKLAAYFDANMLNLYSLVDNKSLARHKLRGISDEHCGLQFSPTGKYLLLTAGGPYDFKMQVLSLPGLTLKHEFTGERGVSYVARFAPDGDEVLLVSDVDNQMWDVATGKLEKSPVQTPANAIAFTKQAPHRLLSIFGAMVEVSQWPSGEAESQWSAGQEISDFAISPDDSVVATCSADDKRIYLWELLTGKQLAEIVADERGVMELEFTADGKWLLSGGYDGRLKMWSTEDWRLRASMVAHYMWLKEIAAIPRSAEFLTIGRLNYNERTAVKRWNLDHLVEVVPQPLPIAEAAKPAFTGGAPLVQFRKTAGAAAGFTNNGQAVYWLDDEGDVRLYSIDDSKPLQTIKVGEPASHMLLSADGKWRVATYDGIVKIADVKENRIVHVWDSKSDYIDAICLAPDGKSLAISAVPAGNDGRCEITFLNVQTGERRDSFTVDSDGAPILEYSPDGSLLAYADYDFELRIRDVETGVDRFTRTLDAAVLEMDFSADGSMLAICVGDLRRGRFHLLETRKGQSTNLLIEPRGQICDVEFSPAGDLLVIGSRIDRQTSGYTFWSIPEGKLVRELNIEPLGVGIGSLEFSPDGKFLAESLFNELAVWRIKDLFDLELQEELVSLQDRGLQVRYDGETIEAYFSEAGANDAALQKLPKITRPFALTMYSAEGITDEGLSHLAKQTEMVGINLQGGEKITATGLAHLQDLPLKQLNLSYTNLASNEGIAIVGKMTQLESLAIMGSRNQASPVDLAPLANLTELRALTIEEISASEEQFVALGKLTKLTHFQLNAKGAKDEYFEPLKGWKNLRELTLSLDDDFTDAGLEYFAGNENLQELVIFSDAFGANGDAQSLSKFPQLKSLHIVLTGISSEGLAAISELTLLESLSLPTQIDDEGFSHLKKLTNVRALDLRDSSITDKGLQHLSNWDSLDSLTLPHNGVTGSGLAALANARELKSLDLRQTSVTNEGMAGVGRLTQLTKLQLPRHLGDAGLSHLTTLEQLEDLELEKTSITDQGIKSLTKLPKLKSLDLTGTAVTDAAIDDLIQLKSLEFLVINETKITLAGRTKFETSQPAGKFIIVFGP